MIQGGASLRICSRNHPPPIKIESDNGLKNLRGTLAMARTRTRTAQPPVLHQQRGQRLFEFTAKTNQGWGYAVFGKVVLGMEVVDEISKVKTGARDVPVEMIKITTRNAQNEAPPPLVPPPTEEVLGASKRNRCRMRETRGIGAVVMGALYVALLHGPSTALSSH